MNQLYTGYYINEEGHILDTRGPTNSLIQNNLIVRSNGVETGYLIKNGRILTTSGDFTGYMIFDNSIFGPFKILPWL